MKMQAIPVILRPAYNLISHVRLLDGRPLTCPQSFSPLPYPVLDDQIGLLSSTMFAGMMFGVVGRGTCTLASLPKPKLSHTQVPISWAIALPLTQLYS